MARPLKNGLDYFPMDTKLDLKLQLLQARYKLEGIGFIDMLYRIIYEEGYYIILGEDKLSLLANQFGITEERFKEILDYCVEKDFFDKQFYTKNQVLTSNGIQKRYFHGTLRRDKNKTYEFLTSETKLLLVKIKVNVSNKYTNKSKVKEIIIKESKEKKIKVNENILELFWEWIEYKNGRKEYYKTDKSLFTCYKSLVEYSGNNLEIAKKILQKSFTCNYQGFFPLNNNDGTNQKPLQIDIESEIRKRYPDIKTAYEKYYKTLQDEDSVCNEMASWVIEKNNLEFTPKLKLEIANKIKNNNNK